MAEQRYCGLSKMTLLQLTLEASVVELLELFQRVTPVLLHRPRARNKVFDLQFYKGLTWRNNIRHALIGGRRNQYAKEHDFMLTDSTAGSEVCHFFAWIGHSLLPKSTKKSKGGE